MDVRRISTMAGLESLEPDWRRLAGDNPFLGPAWLATWWRHFGTRGRELCVLAASDPREGVVAIAPWYLERASWPGRTLRFLGSGAVCTDHLSLPCAAGFRRRAATAIADWLCPKARGAKVPRAIAWDALALEGVEADDSVVRHLAGALERRGAAVKARAAHHVWRLELPENWDDYLAMLSKAQRKRVRRLDRDYFRSGRARLIRAQTPEKLRYGFELLVEQHMRLWSARGREGIFADAAVLEFHREATARLLDDGPLRLTWLELDGRPAAVEYTLAGGGIVYGYQSGMDVARLDHSPGTLSIMAKIRSSIEEGCRAVDFMRGDEPYKRDWRAAPRQAMDVRVFPGHWSGRLHRALWQSGASARDWLRAGRDTVRAADRGVPRQPAQLPPAEREEVASIPFRAEVEVQ